MEIGRKIHFIRKEKINLFCQLLFSRLNGRVEALRIVCVILAFWRFARNLLVKDQISRKPIGFLLSRCFLLFPVFCVDITRDFYDRIFMRAYPQARACMHNFIQCHESNMRVGAFLSRYGQWTIFPSAGFYGIDCWPLAASFQWGLSYRC